MENRQYNFELDHKEVKNLILEKIAIGEIFYPSDIADMYSLDLKTVMDVISKLTKTGQISQR